ncbi:MAG: nuclear transport factor 2 family protein [Candidatus Eisenbacteria bacterium]|nr:nuclear transport factor 2 family protein [Candidatus Eisenbacteria bacterium]
MSLRLALLLVALAAPAPAALTPRPVAPAGAAHRPPPPAADTSAIRAMLDAQVAAWNRGDLEGFMQGYWRSDSLTFYSGGDVSHGWQAAHDRYVRRYRSEGREMGRLDFDLHAITLLAPGQAVVRGGWALELATGRPHGLFTLWLRCLPAAGWRIVHDHSSAAQ